MQIQLILNWIKTHNLNQLRQSNSWKNQPKATGIRDFKKNGTYGEFCTDLSHCFWQAEDKINDERTMPTPSKEEIERNLNDLLLNWSEDLPEAAIHEINKLIDLHSDCLADMPPSSGTSKNESLHKKIKEFYFGKRNFGTDISSLVFRKFPVTSLRWDILAQGYFGIWTFRHECLVPNCPCAKMFQCCNVSMLKRPWCQ